MPKPVLKLKVENIGGVEHATCVNLFDMGESDLAPQVPCYRSPKIFSPLAAAEARAALAQEAKKLLAKHIDYYLAKHFSTSGSIEVNESWHNRPDSAADNQRLRECRISEEIRQDLLKEYCQAGWQVELTGTIFRHWWFTPPKNMKVPELL